MILITYASFWTQDAGGIGCMQAWDATRVSSRPDQGSRYKEHASVHEDHLCECVANELGTPLSNL